MEKVWDSMGIDGVLSTLGASRDGLDPGEV